MTPSATLPAAGPNATTPTLTDINISEQDLLDQINSIDITKATGPDLISPRMLKEAGHTIAPSLTRLFNMSLRLHDNTQIVEAC